MSERHLHPVAVLARGLSIGHGRETVVADLDFRLEAGRTLALVGSNGSGKTTLLKTLAGLLPPLAGAVEVLGGRPLASPERVAYMGQFHPSSFMLPLRAIDIVRMARFARHGLLGRLGTADEIAVQEAMAVMGVEHLARKPLNTLSGGQRQKVFLAQTFAKEADLILLDEPAANLDAPAQAVYRRFVRKCAQAGKAVVVATHDIEEAADYDWTMLLARRVVAFGPCSEILTPQSLMATFGIVGQFQEGRLLIVEREHGHQACGEAHEGPCKH
ncbi:MAG: znuC [Holophagaceae bacterium]|nr:znuC [Holophagaceae bacterium]